MAEELIIRVKVDGVGGGQGQGSNIEAGGAALGIGVGLSRGYKPPDLHRTRVSEVALGELGQYKGKEYWTKSQIEELTAVGGSRLSPTKRLGRLGTARFNIDADASSVYETGWVETTFGEITRTAYDYIKENQKKFKGLGVVAAYKTAYSTVAVVQHQSRDSYYNDQISLNMRAASYGAALAFSGPAAPFVAAGIAANEVANGITEALNYNFDRRIDRSRIVNIKSLASDISYGRSRGGI